MRRWLLRSLVLFALWLVLAATAARAEVVVGILVAIVIATLMARVDRVSQVPVAIRPRWLLPVVKVPGQILQDFPLLARRLVHPEQQGIVRRVPFDVRGTSALDVGRRALLTAGTSIGPNTVVIGWDLERQEVLVHQLERSERVLPVAGGTCP